MGEIVMDSYLPLGQRIALYRRRQGLSQIRLAGLINRSESWVQKVEAGTIPADRISVLSTVADALHVTISDLMADLRSADGDGGTSDVPAVAGIRRQLAQLPGRSGTPRAIDGLRIDVDAAVRLREAARYDDLGAILPALLSDLDATARDADRRTAPSVHALRTMAYGVVRGLLTRFGAHDLSRVAADRALAAADQSEDPAMRVLAGYKLTHAFLGAGRLDDAVDAANATLAEAQEYGTTPGVRALAGATHLPLSISLARQGDRSSAAAALDEAARLARDSIPDRVTFLTQYSPANVGTHAVGALVELGEPGEAIRRAARIDATMLASLSPNRRSRYQLDLAMAHAQRRRTPEMLRAMLEAERIAPESVRHFPLAKEITYAALRRERGAGSPELHAFAERVGVL